jgi:hypothetical protein
MKPVSQLITKIDSEGSSDEEDWPSFTNQNTDQYEDEQDSHYDDNTKVKKSANPLACMILNIRI